MYIKLKDVNLAFYCFTYVIVEGVNDGTVYNFNHQACWILGAIKQANLTKYLGVNSAVRLRSVYEFCEK